MMYRDDSGCTLPSCYCHVLADKIRTAVPLKPCPDCGCRWSDEPVGAGRDPYGRPDPQTNPDFWTE